MKFLSSRKYYATSAGICNLKRALDKQKVLNGVNFISHIAEKKEHLSSKNNLHKYKFRNNFKYNNNCNFYIKNNENKHYSHLFFFHSKTKIEFKNTTDFLI